jgi:hypothetical protein
MKKITVLLFVLFLLLISCNRIEPAVKECAQTCYDSGVTQGSSASQYLMDSCVQYCTQMQYYGGDVALEKVEEEYNAKATFSENLKAGVYDSDIEQCAEWKAEMTNVLNDKQYLGRWVDDYPEIDMNKLKSDCYSMVDEWFSKGSIEALGYEYRTQADSTNEQLEFINEECFPVEFEYKTLVYTKRNDLENRNITKEAYSDCIGMVDNNRRENLDNIIADLPNWK